MGRTPNLDACLPVSDETYRLKRRNIMNKETKKIKWSLLQVCVVPKNKEDEGF